MWRAHTHGTELQAGRGAPVSRNRGHLADRVGDSGSPSGCSVAALHTVWVAPGLVGDGDSPRSPVTWLAALASQLAPTPAAGRRGRSNARADRIMELRAHPFHYALTSFIRRSAFSVPTFGCRPRQDHHLSRSHRWPPTCSRGGPGPPPPSSTPFPLGPDSFVRGPFRRRLRGVSPGIGALPGSSGLNPADLGGGRRLSEGEGLTTDIPLPLLTPLFKGSGGPDYVPFAARICCMPYLNYPQGNHYYSLFRKILRQTAKVPKSCSTGFMYNAMKLRQLGLR
jgi:hypothetical protein